MSIANLHASARRRVLMAMAGASGGETPSFEWPSLGEPTALFDLTAVLNGTLDAKYAANLEKFLNRNAAGQEIPPLLHMFYDQNNKGIASARFAENALLTYADARYGAEAIEAECILQGYGDGMIVACGNGQNNMIAVQARVESSGALSLKTFQDAETAAFEPYGLVEISPLCRVTLRLERQGNRGRVSVKRSSTSPMTELLIETDIAGTNLAAFDPALTDFGFGSGVITANQTTYLTRAAWWLF